MSADHILTSKETLKRWSIGLFLVAFGVYANTLFNGYALDDFLVTTDSNEMIAGGISALPEIFTTPYFLWHEYTADYRPLVKASYAIEYQFFGAVPGISHFINVLLFALVVVLCLRFLTKVFPKQNLHLLGAVVLLFAVHPINTEVVASLKNRDELLSLLFLLASFECGFKWLERKRVSILIMALGLFLLSLLSKMSSVTWIPVLILALWIRDFDRKIALKLVSGFVAVTAIFYALVFGLMDSWGRPFVFIEVPFFELDSMAQKWASIIAAAGYYLKLLVVPYPLCCYYGFDQIPVTDFGDWKVYAALAAYLVLAFYAMRSVLRKDLIGFGAAIILCDLALFVNVLYPYTGIIGERVLFGSSLGVALVLVGLFERGIRQTETSSLKRFLLANKLLGVLILVLAITGSSMSFARNSDWRSHVSLFTNDAEACPRSAKLHQLSAHFMREEYLNDSTQFNHSAALEVIDRYQKSIDVYAEWPVSLYGLGSVWFFDLNDPEKAIPFYELAVSYNPEYVDARYDLFAAYVATARFENAEALLVNIAEDFPNDRTIYNDLVVAMLQAGKIAEATRLNHQFRQAFPSSEIPYIHMGNFALANGDSLAALPYFREALKMNPSYSELKGYLTFLCSKFGISPEELQQMPIQPPVSE